MSELGSFDLQNMKTCYDPDRCDFITEYQERIRELEARLEIESDLSEDHDGISCRDETIKLQDARIDRLAIRNKELEALLKVAACPQCDGGGAYYDNNGEVCQCRFCHERHCMLENV